MTSEFQQVINHIHAVHDALEAEFATATDQRKDEINGARQAIWQLALWIQDQRDEDEREHTLTAAGRRVLELEDENDALREHIKILEGGIINTYDMIDRLRTRETKLETEVELLRVQDETSRAVAESFRVERDAALAKVAWLTEYNERLLADRNTLSHRLMSINAAREEDDVTPAPSIDDLLTAAYDTAVLEQREKKAREARQLQQRRYATAHQERQRLYDWLLNEQALNDRIITRPRSEDTEAYHLFVAGFKVQFRYTPRGLRDGVLVSDQFVGLNDGIKFHEVLDALSEKRRAAQSNGYEVRND